jgi:hypothetical protein
MFGGRVRRGCQTSPKGNGHFPRQHRQSDKTGGQEETVVPSEASKNQEYARECTPLQRAQVKCEQLARDLRKCPDFQLYLLTTSRRDRARMESILMEIPQFSLWRTLTDSVEHMLSETRQCSRTVSFGSRLTRPGSSTETLRSSTSDPLYSPEAGAGIPARQPRERRAPPNGQAPGPR